ncbi:MAG TPA: DUF2950 domain-containing protein [Candidatus Acidoferrales bacterium]
MNPLKTISGQNVRLAKIISPRTKPMHTSNESAANAGRLSRRATFAAAALLAAAVLFASPALHAQAQPAPTPEAKAIQKQAVRNTVKNAKEDAEAAANQTMFDTPDAAMHALADAMKSDDRDALQKMFGSGAQQLLSGDPVEDDLDRASFSAAMQENMQLDQEDDDTYRILVGDDDWPSPIPVLKKGDKWVFDTQAGLNEILDRRVGNNELSAIATSRAYVLAQWEYYVNAYGDNDGLATYAQKFISKPGEQDGLYWQTPDEDDPSPMGKLIAAAEEEGYNKNNPAAKPRKASAEEELAPYHGYYVKILTRQGASAPGGKYNYIINGNMIAGFGMVAFPAIWGNSGVMTFIVNQQGRVYEKNLGPDTDRVAEAMNEYNPDPTWKRVNEDVIDADVDAAIGEETDK